MIYSSRRTILFPKRKNKKNKDEASERDLWTGGRLSFSGALLFNVRYHSPFYNITFPHYGFTGYFAIDQGMDRIAGRRHPLMPGFRFEAGYFYFKKSSLKFMGALCGAGLMWAFPSLKSPWGCFVLAVLPGVSVVHLKKDTYSSTATGYTFSGQAIFGYQKSFGVFSMFIHVRYLYTHRAGPFMHAAGGEVGFGFNAW